MYGKELETNINVQSGGSNVQSPPPAKIIPNLKSEISKIIKPPTENDGFVNSMLNTFIYNKLARVGFMALFFMFFYNIILYVFNFFDVDEIYSYTYTLWISIIVILYTFLPIRLSYLPKSNGSMTFQTMILIFVTIGAFVGSIFLSIYSSFG